LSSSDLSVAIVGAGMSGLYIAKRLQQRDIPFTIYEKAHEVGGTWRDNNYPGLFVDIPTSLYHLNWAPKYDWTHAFAPGPEIQRYLVEVSEEHDLRRHIEFGATITEATWQGDRWDLLTSSGEEISASAVVFATGFLHHLRMPNLEGMHDFQGQWFHSSQWPQDLDVRGKRIGIVGTGSSGIQLVSELAYQDCHVTQFVRTPQWVETCENPESTPEWRERVRNDPALGPELLAELEAGINQDPRLSDQRWKLEPGELRDKGSQALRDHLLAIRDPELRAALTPDYPPGCKRLPKSPKYFQAVQQPNVRIVRGGVVRVEPSGVVSSDGGFHEFDAIVYATGFDPHAYMRPARVTGADGRTLQEVWANRLVSYRGVAVPRFPNLFLLHGPFSPVNNIPVPTTLEDETGYVAWAIDFARKKGAAVAPTEMATETFVSAVSEAIPRTVWADGCDNWYSLNTDVPVIWPWFVEEHEGMFKRLVEEDLEIIPLRATQTVV
jgi:cation diffusion facilitator CzcD-associated flavoprotein CzcO